jgi:hypothetical protein
VPKKQAPTVRMQLPMRNLIPLSLLRQMAPEPQPQKKVAVYRMNQLSWESPCFLGDPCSTCAPHRQCHAGNPCDRCLRGRFQDCERATPARPAFWATIRAAMYMLEWRLATFIHRNTALRLTDDETAHLRDLSCVIDEEVIVQYLAQRFLARIAVDKGWGKRRRGTEIPLAELMRHRFHYR